MPVDDRPTGVPHSRFRVLLRIASGGMGTVYLAQQRGAAGFQRLVAVKRAHPHLLEDPTVARMFATEAHLSSLLRHPNVVGVTDVEDTGGELLLVMEYVEGATLAEIQMGRPMAVPVAMRILLDVCEGLEALHHACDEEGRELGLVHRDVSPQNILVGIEGVSRLADLGIARACAKQRTESRVRGKPSYMAPEYLATGKATPASDVFALGVVAWETLTGQGLFNEDELFVEGGILRRPAAAPPSAFARSIPSEIDEVILRALATDPTMRFRSAIAFAAALEGAAGAGAGKSSAVAARTAVSAVVTKRFGAKLRARRELVQRATPVDARALAASPFDAATIVVDCVTGTGNPTVKTMASGSRRPFRRRRVRLSRLWKPAGMVAALAGVVLAIFGLAVRARSAAASLASAAPAVAVASTTSALVALPSTVDALVASSSPPTPRAREAPVVARAPIRRRRAATSAASAADSGVASAPVSSHDEAPTIVVAPPATAPENPYEP